MHRRALLAMLAFAAGPACAESLGRIGPVHPIAEPHLLEQITARLREKERTGELQRLQQQAQERAQQSVRSPAPVAGLARAAAPRTFYFDPSITLDRNVQDERGRVLFAAGTRKNPLDVVALSKHLLFFDARDAGQVRHARKLIDHYQGKVKPILVGGSYADLMKAWHLPVYYDQGGALVRRLGIAAVPAIVSQHGRLLRIDEVVAE